MSTFSKLDSPMRMHLEKQEIKELVLKEVESLTDKSSKTVYSMISDLLKRSSSISSYYHVGDVSMDATSKLASLINSNRSNKNATPRDFTSVDGSFDKSYTYSWIKDVVSTNIDYCLWQKSFVESSKITRDSKLKLKEIQMATKLICQDIVSVCTEIDEAYKFNGTVKLTYSQALSGIQEQDLKKPVQHLQEQLQVLTDRFHLLKKQKRSKSKSLKLIFCENHEVIVAKVTKDIYLAVHKIFEEPPSLASKPQESSNHSVKERDIKSKHRNKSFTSQRKPTSFSAPYVDRFLQERQKQRLQKISKERDQQEQKQATILSQIVSYETLVTALIEENQKSATKMKYLSSNMNTFQKLARRKIDNELSSLAEANPNILQYVSNGFVSTSTDKPLSLQEVALKQIDPYLCPVNNLQKIFDGLSDIYSKDNETTTMSKLHMYLIDLRKNIERIADNNMKYLEEVSKACDNITDPVARMEAAEIVDKNEVAHSIALKKAQSELSSIQKLIYGLDLHSVLKEGADATKYLRWTPRSIALRCAKIEELQQLIKTLKIKLYPKSKLNRTSDLFSSDKPCINYNSPFVKYQQNFAIASQPKISENFQIFIRFFHTNKTTVMDVSSPYKLVDDTLYEISNIVGAPLSVIKAQFQKKDLHIGFSFQHYGINSSTACNIDVTLRKAIRGGSASNSHLFSNDGSNSINNSSIHSIDTQEDLPNLLPSDSDNSDSEFNSSDDDLPGLLPIDSDDDDEDSLPSLHTISSSSYFSGSTDTEDDENFPIRLQGTGSSHGIYMHVDLQLQWHQFAYNTSSNTSNSSNHNSRCIICTKSTQNFISSTARAASQFFRLHIRQLDGILMSVNFPVDSMVMDIANVITTSTGIPRRLYKLLYHNSLMFDDQHISFYDITGDPTQIYVINMVLKHGLRGGMNPSTNVDQDENYLSFEDPPLSVTQAPTPVLEQDALNLLSDEVATNSATITELKIDINSISNGVTALHSQVASISASVKTLADLAGEWSIDFMAIKQNQQTADSSIKAISEKLKSIDTKRNRSDNTHASGEETKRKSLLEVLDVKVASTNTAKFSAEFFSSPDKSISVADSLIPASAPAISIRENSLKKSAQNWFQKLSSKDRFALSKCILKAKPNPMIHIDISSGKLNQYYIDAAIDGMNYDDTTTDDWEGRINYFVIDSGYMLQHTAPSNSSSFSSGPGGGVVVMQRQSDTIPDSLKLHPNVSSITCMGSTLYHVINFKKNYDKWLSHPGNTPDTVRLVFAVPPKLLTSITVAQANYDLMVAGGYNSTNVAKIPNDVFLRMMFRMLRPSSSHEFLMVMSDAAKFPAYPKDVRPQDIAPANLDVMIELGYIFCDKIISTYNILCTDIKDINILPSMYNRDEPFGGLKGLFTSNFKPTHYIVNRLSGLPQRQRDMLKSDITFFQYVSIVKQLLVDDHETWRKTFKEVASMLVPRKAPDLGEAAAFQRLSYVTSTDQNEVIYDDSHEELDDYLDSEFETVEDSDKEALLSFTSNPSASKAPSTTFTPSALKPPHVGKQFDARALSTSSKTLYVPKSSLGKSPVDASKMPCFNLLQKGECTTTSCKYSHDEKIVQEVMKRYGDNIHKFFSAVKNKPRDSTAKKSLTIMEEPTKEIMLQELQAMADAQGFDVDPDILVENFSVIKLHEAPNAASRNFSAVHMEAVVLLTGRDNVQVRQVVKNTLLDTGASHGSYISKAIVSEWIQKGFMLTLENISTRVRLGDNKTIVPITMRVTLPIEFTDTHSKITYIGSVICSVIDSGPEVPIIIGLPAIGRYYTALVCSTLERYALTMQSESEYLTALEALELTVPWTLTPSPIAVEEIETVETGFFESLSGINEPRAEAINKYTDTLQNNIAPEWKTDKSYTRLYQVMTSSLAHETFVPKEWLGFKNVQAIGANEDNEFKIQFKDTLPDSIPCQPRVIPERLREAAVPVIENLMNYLFTHSDSPIASPMTIAPKATDPYVRPAGDFRIINLHIDVNQEFIPRVQVEINKCKEFEIFLDFDMTNSFHQIKLDFLSSSRLSVSTILGLLRPRFLPEGVSCGSMMLQKIVRYIFREIESYSIILFDNILILAHDYEDAINKIETFLAICRHHNVILKMAKTFLGFREAKFFGYVVKQHTVSLAPERKEAIMNIAFPRNLKEAQSFLGASIFFKTFVHKFSEYAAHIAAMTTGKFSWNQDTWTVDYRQKFEEFKQALCNACTIHYPDYNLPWIIQVDGSNLAVGGVLFQVRDGAYEPIAFISHKLSDAATRWSIIKIECYAIYFTVFKLQHLLLGKQFIIETDHQNLLFMEKSEFAIIIRWRCFLQQFAFFLRHIPGKLNVLADYLSRVFSVVEEEGVEAAYNALQMLATILSANSTSTDLIAIQFEGPVKATIEARPTATWSFLFDAYLRKLVVHHDIPVFGFHFLFQNEPINPRSTLEQTGASKGDIIVVVPVESNAPALAPITTDSTSGSTAASIITEIGKASKEFRKSSVIDRDKNAYESEIGDTVIHDDLVMSPEQCITWLLNIWKTSLTKKKFKYSSIEQYRLAMSQETTNNPVCYVLESLAKLCEMPYLDIKELQLLNMYMNRFSVSYDCMEKARAPRKLNLHEYMHYARLPCSRTSSVKLSSTDTDMQIPSEWKHDCHISYAVMRDLVIADLHNTSFPPVHFTHELVIPAPHFNFDAYCIFVNEYIKENIQLDSIKTLADHTSTDSDINVIVRHVSFYSKVKQQQIPAKSVLFRSGSRMLVRQFIQEWARNFVLQNLHIPVLYIRVFCNGKPLNMHTKWVPASNSSVDIPVFDIFVIPTDFIQHSAQQVLTPNEDLTVYTHLINCVIGNQYHNHLSLQPVMNTNTRARDLLHSFKLNIMSTHSYYASNKMVITFPVYISSEPLEDTDPYITTKCYPQPSQLVRNLKRSNYGEGLIQSWIEFDVCIIPNTDEVLSYISRDIDTLYKNLAYRYELKQNPNTLENQLYLKGTDVIVNMDYWLGNIQERVKMTQGSAKNKQKERIDMIAKRTEISSDLPTTIEQATTAPTLSSMIHNFSKAYSEHEKDSDDSALYIPDTLSVMTRSKGSQELELYPDRSKWNYDDFIQDIGKRHNLGPIDKWQNIDQSILKEVLERDDYDRYHNVHTNFKFNTSEDQGTSNSKDSTELKVTAKRKRYTDKASTTENTKNTTTTTNLHQRPVSTDTSSTSIQPDTFVEVECKFKISDDLIQYLRASQQFHSTTFTDKYFDTQNFFYMINDLWIRQRDTIFEVKYPSTSGHYGGIRSYVELRGMEEVVKFLAAKSQTNHINFQSDISPFDQLSLINYATITTHRHTFNITLPVKQQPTAHVFKIDVDVAELSCHNFTSKYQVAEIEMIQPTPGFTVLETFQDIMDQLSIDKQCIDTPIRGKLIETIYRHMPQLYSTLVQTNIVEDEQHIIPEPMQDGYGGEIQQPDDHEAPRKTQQQLQQDIHLALENSQNKPFSPQYPNFTRNSNHPRYTLTDDELEQLIANEEGDIDTSITPELIQRLAEANSLTMEHMKEIHTGDTKKLHYGAKKMYLRCKELFPGNSIPISFFEEYVGKCGYCQKIRAKFSMHFNRLVKTLKSPTYKRAAIGIDVLHVGHADVNGNTLVIIIVQGFARHVYAYATNTYEATTVVMALMSYYCIFGIFDVMWSDPGSDLLAEVVQLFNKSVNVEHRISLVDEHGSSGVENQGCKKIMEHLKYMIAGDRTLLPIWSTPPVLGYAVMLINTSIHSEIECTPLEAIFGKPDEAYLKTILPPTESEAPPSAPKYLKELWNTQRNITQRSMEYQRSLHDKRMSTTPWTFQKKYAKGDLVLKVREDLLKVNKLFRYKYLGPYKVTRHEVGSNFVYCYHMASGKEYVFAIDKLIPYFGDDITAVDVAKLDDQSLEILDVKFYKGNPLKRTTLEFLIRFEDDLENEYNWYPFSRDLITTNKVIEYCNTVPELSLLHKTQAEETIILSDLKSQKVTIVKPKDVVYIDLRTWSYGSSWFDDLNLPNADSKLYLVKGIYLNAYLNGKRKIDLQIPIFKHMGRSKESLLSVDQSFIYLFGIRRTFDDNTSILVDEQLIQQYPKLKNSGDDDNNNNLLNESNINTSISTDTIIIHDEQYNNINMHMQYDT